MLNSALEKIKIPKLYDMHQSFPDASLPDYAGLLLSKLDSINVKRGQRIAITAGSRGICGYAELVTTIAGFIRSKGAHPFIVPSMGSHGAGAFEGQLAVLKKLGIDKTIAEIVPMGEIISLGSNASDGPVLVAKAFLDADGVIILNRIKPHTSFRGEYESGIVKMAAIGMGGPLGAGTTHRAGYMKMAANIISAARIIFSKLNIICAVATVENAYGDIAELDVLRKNEILSKEPELLKKAWMLLPRLPSDDIDVLIVDEIGKDISGTGMDTNIIGRYHTKAAFGGPDINKIVVLGLSKKTGGNANGIGLADFTTKQLFDQIDFESTYLNVLTSTEPNSAKIPPVMDSSELAIKAALYTCGKQQDIKIIRIKNTKQLGSIKVTKNLLPEQRDRNAD